MIARDKIYIAGALNSDACGYIENLSRMTKYANKVKRLGNAVFSPGNDFIQGLVDGGFKYEDYFNNSLLLLASSDAMFIVPGSEKSEGVAKEKIFAEKKGIPILEDIESLIRFNTRPKILAIIGESGSGKSVMAEYFNETYRIPMIESHTDRPRRHPDETGHTFYSPHEFNKFKREDMIAYTEFGGHRYCCLKRDVKDKNTYVMDENGILMLDSLYGNRYKVCSVRIKRALDLRLDAVGEERITRDEGMFWLPDSFYDVVIDNDKDIDFLYESADEIYYDFFLN